jgi:hypothetical protein
MRAARPGRSDTVDRRPDWAEVRINLGIANAVDLAARRSGWLARSVGSATSRMVAPGGPTNTESQHCGSRKGGT